MAGTPLPELATWWNLQSIRFSAVPFTLCVTLSGDHWLLDESSLLLVWNSCFKCVFKLFQVSTLLIPRFHVVVGISPLSKVSLPNRSLATVSQDLRGNMKEVARPVINSGPIVQPPLPRFLSSLWLGLKLDNYTIHPGTHVSIHYWLRNISPPPPAMVFIKLDYWSKEQDGCEGLTLGASIPVENSKWSVGLTLWWVPWWRSPGRPTPGCRVGSTSPNNQKDFSVDVTCTLGLTKKNC